MSDEAVESVPGLTPIQYTAKHYALYLNKMAARSAKLNKGQVIAQGCTMDLVFELKILHMTTETSEEETFDFLNSLNFCLFSSVDPQRDWTPHRLELCLWAMTTASQQQLQLLQDVEVKGSTKETSDPDTEQRPAKKLRTV